MGPPTRWRGLLLRLGLAHRSQEVGSRNIEAILKGRLLNGLGMSLAVLADPRFDAEP